MKLVKEEIQFIDTYLENNDVVYADIRQEMTGHIATAVEEKMATEHSNFYDAFKEYMVSNKQDILKNNKTRLSFSGQALKQFLLFLAKPYMLVLGVALFFFFKTMNVNPYFNEDFTVSNLFTILVIVLMLIQIAYMELYLKKRFYATEKTIVVLIVLYYLQLFLLPVLGKKDVSVYTLTIFTFLFLGYIVFFTRTIVKFNQNQYNYI